MNGIELWLVIISAIILIIVVTVSVVAILQTLDKNNKDQCLCDGYGCHCPVHG